MTISILCVFAALACDSEPSMQTETATPWGGVVEFDHPQALRYVDGYLLVTNSGYDPEAWRPGTVVVIDDRGQEAHRFTTSRLNPQRILLDDSYIYIINTGTYDFSDFSTPRSASPGSIDRIRRDSLSATELEVDHLDFADHPSFVSPVDGAILGTEMVVTSGLLSGFVRIDLESFSHIEDTVFYGDPASIGLGSITSWDLGFVIADFNQDQLTFLDESGQVICQKDAGSQGSVLEGTSSPRIYGETLYVTLSLAGVIKSMPLNADDLCSGSMRDTISPLGQVPNDLWVQEEYLWVVHSGDNKVTGYPRKTDGAPLELLCPVGSNPWHMALHPNGRELAVTEWKSNGVTIFDLESGTQLRISAESTP